MLIYITNFRAMVSGVAPTAIKGDGLNFARTDLGITISNSDNTQDFYDDEPNTGLFVRNEAINLVFSSYAKQDKFMELFSPELATKKKVLVRRSKEATGSTLGAYTYSYTINVDDYYNYSYTMSQEGYRQLLNLFGTDIELIYEEV